MSTDETKVTKAKAEKRVGFKDNGKPYKGVDPTTGERMSVVLDELNAEFGIKEGVAKYYAIANLEGEWINPQTGETVRGRYFFDPNVEKGYRPDLVIAQLPAEVKKQVANILSTPQAEE